MKSYKLTNEKKQGVNLDSFERLEKEVEHLIGAYAKLKEEIKTIRQAAYAKNQEVAELQRRVSKLEQDRYLALEKVNRLLEQINQIDLG